MMSCGKCFKWQHIACHDLTDKRAGRSKRNWDSVEFICLQCRSRMFAGIDEVNSTFEDIRYNRHPAQGMNSSSPSNNLTTHQAYGTSEATPQAPIPSPLYHGSDPIHTRLTVISVLTYLISTPQHPAKPTSQPSIFSSLQQMHLAIISLGREDSAPALSHNHNRPIKLIMTNAFELSSIQPMVIFIRAHT